MEIDGTTTVHKVHFPESLDAFGHDSSILVQPLNDVHINVHLGFIQVNHRYEVRFQFDSPPHLGSLSVRTQDPPNLNLRVLELKPVISSGPRYEVVLELLAYKEKLLREQLLLQSCNNPLLTLTLMLNARVLECSTSSARLLDTTAFSHARGTTNHLRSHDARAKTRGPSAQKECEERLDGKSHFIYKLPGRSSKDCAVCSDRKTNGGRRETVFFCKTCSNNPGLHPGECFERYHTLLKYR